MPRVEIICLANSRKHSHYCIAGLRTDGTGWVRPIGTVPDGSLYTGEIILQDGTLPRVLDIVTVNCSKPQPRPHQPENCSIERTKWQLVARPAPSAIMSVFQAGVAKGPELLGGLGDRVDYNSFSTQPAKSSLALVAPENLYWRIKINHRGKRQTRACFDLNGAAYDLVVTDPEWENRLDALNEGSHLATAAGLTVMDIPFFTVSLGEPFDPENSGNPFCFKLIAGVILL